MGWKRRSRVASASPVSLSFHLDGPRNVTRVDIFCAGDRPYLGIAVPSSVRLTFKSSAASPSTLVHAPDPAASSSSSSSSSRWVSAPVDGGRGRRAEEVAVEMHFGDVWMLVSEVAFVFGGEEEGDEVGIVKEEKETAAAGTTTPKVVVVEEEGDDDEATGYERRMAAQDGEI